MSSTTQKKNARAKTAEPLWKPIQNLLLKIEANPAVHFKFVSKNPFFQVVKRASVGRFFTAGKLGFLVHKAFHFHQG